MPEFCVAVLPKIMGTTCAWQKNNEIKNQAETGIKNDQ